MHIIEDLAFAKYNSQEGSVEVNFWGHGDVFLYRLAFPVAIDIANAHQIRKWIFIKTNFSDIDSSKFLAYVKEYMRPCEEYGNDNHEIIVITKVQAVKKMNAYLKYDNLYDGGNRLNERFTIAIKEKAELVPVYV